MKPIIILPKHIIKVQNRECWWAQRRQQSSCDKLKTTEFGGWQRLRGKGGMGEALKDYGKSFKKDFSMFFHTW